MSSACSEAWWLGQLGRLTRRQVLRFQIEELRSLSQGELILPDIISFVDSTGQDRNYKDSITVAIGDGGVNCQRFGRTQATSAQ